MQFLVHMAAVHQHKVMEKSLLESAGAVAMLFLPVHLTSAVCSIKWMYLCLLDSTNGLP